MSEPNENIKNESIEDNSEINEDVDMVEVENEQSNSVCGASDSECTELEDKLNSNESTPPSEAQENNTEATHQEENKEENSEVTECTFINDVDSVSVIQPLSQNMENTEEENKQPPQQKVLSNEEVTGHTATLWKYLPIPDKEPEPVPEYINGMIELPGSKVIAARVRGKKHKHEGTNCDDWYEISNYKNITFVAVSDGAGSKKFSRIGARESCKAAIGYLVNSFEEMFSTNDELKTNLMLELSDQRCINACGILAGIVQKSVIKAREAVEAAFYSRKTNVEYEKVLGRGLALKDFSGTLLIAVIIPIDTATKEHLVISCQIGDGMIAVLNSNGEFANSIKLMGVPDSGDFSGETDFLTSSQMADIEKLQNRTKISRTIIDTVMVMSDGVADDYFPNETQMRRLYFDLVVNRVLDKFEEPLLSANLTAEQMKLFKRIPDPLVYPWVNDQNIKIPVQYTNRIMESTGLTLEDLWKDPMALNLAQLELKDNEHTIDMSERLKIWLDNYVERGSFDDRTLVVVTM